MVDPEKLKKLEAQVRTWAEQSKNGPERDALFENLSNTPLQRVYTPLDTQDLDDMSDISLPGQYPFTRGIHATGYRGKVWTMRMFAGFGTAEETNQRFKYLLEHGETGLSVAFDMPTLYGYDTDHPVAEGEFGKCGVAVSSLADMEVLFNGIPLDKISTSMTINGPAAIIWAMYLAAAEKQGIPLERLRGTLQNDILKEYIAQNEYIFPPSPSMRLVVDTLEFGAQHLPQWNPISVSGYHIREAGSTAIQELAFTVADGFAYVEACLERGMDIDSFAPHISFFFNVHNDFFEEVCKFRAARRIWAQEMRHNYKAKNERSWWLRTHAQTAGCSLTAQQPQVNAVRVALQALAAVLGGVQSLHTNSQDEALALPSEEAVLLALRTQQVIAEETGVVNTVDPLGGSYYVEWLTKKMEEGAYEYFRKIEAQGGVVPAIEQGFFQREIAEASYRYQKELEKKQRVIVGVNEYVTEEVASIPILRVDRAGEKRHLERLNRVRRGRGQREVARTLAEVERAAKGGKNIMPPVLEAVKAYATLGEICGVLRQVFGEYQPTGAVVAGTGR
jgi:methylmalonyl-CoA mutase N-terminal domain/subunit